jgi:hypothetical protein
MGKPSPFEKHFFLFEEFFWVVRKESGTGRWTPGALQGAAAGVGQRLAARKMGADLDSWIAKVRACEYLPENDLKQLCQMVLCVSERPRAPAAGATGESAAALPRRDCHPALSVVGARVRAPTEARRAAGVCAASAEPPRVRVSVRTALASRRRQCTDLWRQLHRGAGGVIHRLEGRRSDLGGARADWLLVQSCACARATRRWRCGEVDGHAYGC